MIDITVRKLDSTSYSFSVDDDVSSSYFTLLKVAFFRPIGEDYLGRDIDIRMDYRCCYIPSEGSPQHYELKPNSLF